MPDESIEEMPAVDASSQEDIALDVATELLAYLREFDARLIHANGAVAVEVSGQVELNGIVVPFSLIPEQGVLARIQKWRKFPPDRQLALVKERINPDGIIEFSALVNGFVAEIIERTRREGLDANRFLGALRSGKELATRRFRIVEDRIEEALYQQRQAAQAQATVGSVKLALYPESFELAFGMRRRLVAVLGPTNSGKTHRAMEALAQAKSGVYLAPLRLLALENYERLVDRDIAVSLVTGEERRLTPGATHVASTIEMLDTSRRVEVAVIDEIQMLEDTERGSAWTAAVCGVPADTVFLVGSLAAHDAVVALAERLGCPLEIISLARMSPLEVEMEPVRSVGQLKRGDAVIAFSRRDVLAWASVIAQGGMSVATIYGNLSPEVRRAQARRFRDGEADVVVATDAIGMGLNMPISRVVFTTSNKYDGISEDILPAWLTQQIGGRAGRYGIHEAGHVAGFDDSTHRVVSRLMRAPLEKLSDRGFYVTPTLHHLKSISAATREQHLSKLLELFSRNIDLSDDFFLPSDLSEQIERARWLDMLPLSLEYRFTLSLVPISTRVDMLNEAWQTWARNLSKERSSRLSLEPVEGARYPLQAAEDACKKYSAYAWLGYRMPDYFPDGEMAVSVARSLSERIDQMLAAQNSAQRDSRRHFGAKVGTKPGPPTDDRRRTSGRARRFRTGRS